MAWLQLAVFAQPDEVDPISDILMVAGASAVTYRDAADQPIFEPPPGATPIWQYTQIIGLFEHQHDIDHALQLITDNLSSQILYGHTVEILEDNDWTSAWLQHAKPMCFGKNLWVLPHDEPTPAPDATYIKLSPGLAFGTGNHATTGLCLEWLANNPPKGKTMIDYGCGSGILAIAASKLGAERVWAVDIDPQALAATEANAANNELQNGQIIATLPDKLDAPCVDLLIANILANPLIELSKSFSDMLIPGGKIVLSGILFEQISSVETEYSRWFDLEPPTVQEEWARIQGVRR